MKVKQFYFYNDVLSLVIIYSKIVIFLEDGLGVERNFILLYCMIIGYQMGIILVEFVVNN